MYAMTHPSHSGSAVAPASWSGMPHTHAQVPGRGQSSTVHSRHHRSIIPPVASSVTSHNNSSGGGGGGGGGGGRRRKNSSSGTAPPYDDTGALIHFLSLEDRTEAIKASATAVSNLQVVKNKMTCTIASPPSVVTAAP